MKSGHEDPLTVTAAIITVSTTRNEDTDMSGKTIRKLLENEGIRIGYYRVVPDRIPPIQQALVQALTSCNCIIINGGTGLTHDDCTIEAVSPLLQKRIEGFGEIFRMMSYEEIGTSSMLSRALAGIHGGSAIFCIPGSTGAVTLATSALIIPEIRHILTHAGK